jgi:hypothetical protein
MGKFVDMTGWIMKEHGVPDSRLIVVGRGADHITPSGRACICWDCVCECDASKIITIDGNSLRRGLTKSCGCLKIERTIETNKKYNRYDVSGEFGIGWTTNTNREFYFDLEDYDKIKDYCWCETTSNTGLQRISARVNNKNTYMHVLLGFKNYDHIDRNEFNNRKSNLRKCTREENARNAKLRKNNSSGVTGVYWSKKENKWIARIVISKKFKRVGCFTNKDDAIIARLQAESKYYKEFAPQRHLFEKYDIGVDKE